MQASIQTRNTPELRYVLRLADTLLILGQRTAEWCGHGPVLEEDIALSNMALDLIGQARGVFTLAGRLDGQGHGEDQLAFLREERDYLNPTLVELPRGDFAVTVLRNAMMSAFFQLLWQRLEQSCEAELAGIAGKAVKEARYHRRHSFDWLERLALGTGESRRRTERALQQLWPYVAELFAADDADRAAAASGLGPDWSDLQADWLLELNALLAAAGLQPPVATPFRSHGRQGRHSEHMGYMLAEMQHLQRAYPGAVW